MILFINACVREESRTQRLARALLKKLGEPYEELYLPAVNLQPLSSDRLNQRTELIAQGDYNHPIFDLAKQFAQADQIIIAAPFWDLSFPAILKTYLENIYVTGIVSRFGADGQPHGLCKAKKLYYVTTAGGAFVPDYSYRYIEELAKVHFGIPQVELIEAQMLDVDGFDAEEIVMSTINRMKE